MRGFLRLSSLMSILWMGLVYGEPCKEGVSYPIADPHSCVNYYECNDKKELELKSCLDGFHYNPELQMCDDPELAGCILEPEPTTGAPTTMPPTEPIPEPTTEAPTTIQPTEAPTTIPPTEPPTTIPPTEPQTTSSPTEPQTTISPTEPQTTSSPTEPQTTSSPIEPQTTSSPTEPQTTTSTSEPNTTEAPTTSTVIPTTQTTTEPETTTNSSTPTESPEVVCGPGVQYVPHPTNCTLFYECSNYTPYLFTCPSGLHFSPIYLRCMSAELAECTAEGGSNEDLKCEEEGKLYPDPKDCSKYYACQDGQVHTYQCPPGLHFNPNIGFCDWPQNVDCNATGKTEQEHLVASSLEEYIGDDKVNNTDIKEDQEETRRLCNVNEVAPPSLNDPDCPNVGDITLTHKVCCNFYIECTDGTKFERFCPGDLYYNAETNQCDWPKNVTCQTDKVIEN